MSNEELRLEEPNISHEHKHQEMLEEFLNNGEQIVPRTMRIKPRETYTEFLQRVSDRKVGINLPEQRVPGSLYFIVGQNKKLIGAISIRFKLNKELERLGGHIGYGIRPSERKKGYATKALRLALKKCKELGIDKIIITCSKHNIGSSKVIQNNGGILQCEYICKENNNTPTQIRHIIT